VNFTLLSSPSYTLAMVHWNLPDKFVNEPQPSQGSFSYIKDNSLLFNTCPPDSVGTTCWYVNGTGGTVSATVTYSFANGQTVSIAPQGTISVYRPSILQFMPTQPAPVVNLINGYIELDGLTYSFRVLSQYAGNGDFTQIISRQAQNGSSAPTTINAYLDSFPFYINKSWTSGSFTVSPNVLSRWSFQDSPQYALGSGIYGNTTSISDQFTDYIMFCPSGTGNTYVTLGTVTWSWTSSTTYINGNWTPPLQVTHAPTGNDTSDSFPVWTHVFNP
jgi:hypothetical protein